MTDANRAENARREMARAEAALAAARGLAQLGLWDDAVSRAYYAAFHAAKAALFSAGLQARTHEGTHDLLFQHFVATGALGRKVSKGLAALQRYREQADSSTTIRFDAESGAEEVDRAAGIVGEITDLLRSRSVLVVGSPPAARRRRPPREHLPLHSAGSPVHARVLVSPGMRTPITVKPFSHSVRASSVGQRTELPATARPRTGSPRSPCWR